MVGFFADGDSLDRATEGTGISLAVADRIVEQRGVRIPVECTPGEGFTCFLLTLQAA